MYSRWVHGGAAGVPSEAAEQALSDLETIMADRPCRTDADLRWLWRNLLPGTSLPNCDAARDPASDRDDDSAPTQKPTYPIAKDRPQRR
jgi:hypothetical protein